MIPTPTRPDEKSLNECRVALDKVVLARHQEAWSLESQLQEIRKSAIRKAVDEGWPIETVSEASGVPVAEVHEILDSR